MNVPIEGISTSERRRRLFLRAEQLATLPENWDSYGAGPIDEKTLGKAVELGLNLIPSEQSFFLFPGGDGSVQIEWSRDGFDVEIYVHFVGRSPSTGISDASEKGGDRAS